MKEQTISTIANLHQELADEFGLINDLILQRLDVNEDLVEVISGHLLKSAGKRLRPMISILVAKTCGHFSENIIRLATAVEFIHMATLLHDDVVDGSKMRRFLPTANVLWGNSASVLVGDFLFSQSFELIAETSCIPAIKSLSRAASIISRGEIKQLSQLNGKTMLQQQDYFRVIKAKTAELFSAACHSSAIVANPDNTQMIETMRQFGLILGTMFQITDDCLDYTGTKARTGKNIGDDFLEGKITLPLILLHELLAEPEQQALEAMLTKDSRTEEELLWVQESMRQFNIKQACLDNLELMQAQAQEKIAAMPQNKYSEMLNQILLFTIERNH